MRAGLLLLGWMFEAPPKSCQLVHKAARKDSLLNLTECIAEAPHRIQQVSTNRALLEPIALQMHLPTSKHTLSSSPQPTVTWLTSRSGNIGMSENYPFTTISSLTQHPLSPNHCLPRLPSRLSPHPRHSISILVYPSVYSFKCSGNSSRNLSPLSGISQGTSISWLRSRNPIAQDSLG